MRINSVHEEYTACTSEKSQFAREKRIIGRFESIPPNAKASVESRVYELV